MHWLNKSSTSTNFKRGSYCVLSLYLNGSSKVSWDRGFSWPVNLCDWSHMNANAFNGMPRPVMEKNTLITDLVYVYSVFRFIIELQHSVSFIPWSHNQRCKYEVLSSWDLDRKKNKLNENSIDLKLYYSLCVWDFACITCYLCFHLSKYCQPSLLEHELQDILKGSEEN